MRQTAVESIIEKINNVKPTEFCSIETIKKWCIEAKEIEKEQKAEDWQLGYAACELYYETR
jgi:hypothetical protein